MLEEYDVDGQLASGCELLLHDDVKTGQLDRPDAIEGVKAELQVGAGDGPGTTEPRPLQAGVQVTIGWWARGDLNSR